MRIKHTPAIMNPVPGTNELLRLEKHKDLKKLLNHPKAPKIDHPTEKQFDVIMNYWSMVLKHFDTIISIQKYDPDYMPPCEMVEIIGGNVRFTSLVN